MSLPPFIIMLMGNPLSRLDMLYLGFLDALFLDGLSLYSSSLSTAITVTSCVWAWLEIVCEFSVVSSTPSWQKRPSLFLGCHGSALFLSGNPIGPGRNVGNPLTSDFKQRPYTLQLNWLLSCPSTCRQLFLRFLLVLNTDTIHSMHRPSIFRKINKKIKRQEQPTRMTVKYAWHFTFFPLA